MSRRVQKAPRKRTGCVTCKNAHVKCTEEKPVCRRCQRLVLSCQYEFKLLWEEDALQRNIVHGRAGVWSRDGRKVEPVPGSLRFAEGKEAVASTHFAREEWDFVNFNPEDFIDGIPMELREEYSGKKTSTKEDGDDAWEIEILDGVTPTLHGRALDGALFDQSFELADEEIDPTLITYHPMLPYASSFGINPFLRPSSYPFSFSEVDSQLLTYYIYELSPKCSLSIDLNPYLKVLLPVAHDFAPLRHMLLAAASCQLYHYNGDRQYEMMSLRHRSKAILGLNKHLNTEQMDWPSLATMVMFCFRDITDGCEPSWITHLQMGLQMLKKLLCTTHIDKDLRKFCDIYFVAHDVMGRTAWEDDPTGVEHYTWDQDEDQDEIDSMMGCSRSLISLISQISDLAARARYRTSPASDIAASAKHLMSQLSTLHQTLHQNVANASAMFQVAEVKRLSAILYLHDRVMAPHTNNAHPFAHSIREAVINAVEKLPLSSGASLWPLFVLGKSNLSSQPQAQFVLDRLHQLEKSRYLGSFHHARKRIQRNVRRRLMARDGVVQKTWEDDRVLNDNERWVSLA